MGGVVPGRGVVGHGQDTDLSQALLGALQLRCTPNIWLSRPVLDTLGHGLGHRVVIEGRNGEVCKPPLSLNELALILLIHCL